MRRRSEGEVKMASLLCVKSLQGNIQVHDKEGADGLCLTIDEDDKIRTTVSSTQALLCPLFVY